MLIKKNFCFVVMFVVMLFFKDGLFDCVCGCMVGFDEYFIKFFIKDSLLSIVVVYVCNI